MSGRVDRPRPAEQRPRAAPRSPACAARRCATALIESRLTPNAISLTGFVLNVVAAVLVWQELFFLGGLAFIVGSVCDTLDGRYSRMSGKGTPFGAFLDSTLDRIEEGIVLTAVAAYFATRRQRPRGGGRSCVAVLASLMVSYTRARAEALGVECKVGIATRAVRVVILVRRASCSADLGAPAPAVYVLAALSTITVLQRIFHVRKALNGACRAPVADAVTGPVSGGVCEPD